MPKLRSSHITVSLLASLLAILTSACSNSSFSNSLQRVFNSSSTKAPIPVADAATPPISAVPSPTPRATPTPSGSAPAVTETYPLALAKATSAVSASQSAQSQDDWRFVASRWQQAIDLLSAVPKSNRHYAMAQSKLVEYRRNLATAQQRSRSVNTVPDSNRVVIVQPRQVQPRSTPMPLERSTPDRSSASQTAGTAAIPSQPSNPHPHQKGTYSAPIIRRAGGTPVIRVMFNGNQPFDMIVDTGASSTLITESMAKALGVVPTNQMRIDTASAQNVTFPMGKVQSIEVNGAVAQDVLVAIGSPGMDIGLLGHDFFGNYDVTIRESFVEFQER